MAYPSKSWRDSQGRPRDPTRDMEETFDDLAATTHTRLERIKVAKETGKHKKLNPEEAEREELVSKSSVAVLLLREHLAGKVRLMNQKVYITWGLMAAQWLVIWTLLKGK